MNVIAKHDPGGKNHLPLLSGYVGDAFFIGPNLEHRIWLSRVPISMPLLPFNYALWLGVNPSTASATEDDMTIRKDMGFTRLLGLDAIAYMKMNVASYRATDQKRFNDLSIEINHPRNHLAIRCFAKSCGTVIAATGNPHPRLQPLALDLFGMLLDDGVRLKCLGLTNEGWPRHSSRIAYATPFEDYQPIR